MRVTVEYSSSQEIVVAWQSQQLQDRILERGYIGNICVRQDTGEDMNSGAIGTDSLSQSTKPEETLIGEKRDISNGRRVKTEMRRRRRTKRDNAFTRSIDYLSG